MGIGTCARGHTTAHHGGGIHLTTGAGGGHVSGHLLRHTRLSAGLTGIMSHAGGGHVMTWRNSRVLLHTAGMKTAWHSHHVGKIILWVDDPPEWIIDAPTLVAISCVFYMGGGMEGRRRIVRIVGLGGSPLSFLVYCVMATNIIPR